jgi:hypothetical protein
MPTFYITLAPGISDEDFQKVQKLVVENPELAGVLLTLVPEEKISEDPFGEKIRPVKVVFDDTKDQYIIAKHVEAAYEEAGFPFGDLNKAASDNKD